MTFEIDMQNGLETAAVDAAGTRTAGGPLLRWVDWSDPAAPASAIRAALRPRSSGEAGNVELGPAGLACGVGAPTTGRFGETRREVTLTNQGEGDIHGMLLPPFCGWLGGAADAEAFCLAHDRAYRGGGRGMYAWTPREFAKDVFVTVPGGDGRSVTAVLVRKSGGDDGKERGGLSLRPGETVALDLHLDAVPGSRIDALREIWRVRGGYRVDPQRYDRRLYENPARAWVRDIVVSWLNWAWDEEVMDPVSGEYRLAESLDRARRAHGGYDVYMLWPFWPRAGFDDRFQFDHYRDLPGGLPGVRRLVNAAQAQGTRMVVSSCIWSESDRDSSPEALRKSFRSLVELALDVEADGVLMDILSATPEELLAMARERGRELTPFNEGDPSWEESQVNLVGRIHNNFPMPGFNLKKYLLPHHPILRVCEPGNLGKVMRNDIGMSFFQGHGVEINTMFPQKSPACDGDWDLLSRAAGILRSNRACFRSAEWEPFAASAAPDVWINRWPSPGKTLYTICCTDPAGHRGDLLRLPHDPAVRYVDLWRSRAIEPRREGATDVLSYDIEGYTPGQGMERGTGDYSFGCVAAFVRRIRIRLEMERLSVEVDASQEGDLLEVWVGDVSPAQEPVRRDVASGGTTVRLELDLYRELGRHTNEALVVRLLHRNGQLRDLAVEPAALVRFFRIDRPEPTTPLARGAAPTGMVAIPPGTFRYTLRQSQSEFQATYAHEWQELRPEAEYVREVTLPGFWMDPYPVTNDQYAEFIAATGYRPEESTAFLRHFRDARPPADAGAHPVVYVSYEDAKAFARWTGKRLPTEEEWAYAAEGSTGRPWPWGEAEPEDSLCNVTARATTAVDAHPAGASPFGVQDLVGNVWQWTASLMHNGRHRLVFLRGGSWYRPPQGMWWVLGGPRRITDHHPLPLFGPAMNRLSTVGFRCVRDA